MRIIDNINELLGDDLRSELRSGSKVRIAASTFSIFAFEALSRELQQIDELEFIFTNPAFTALPVDGGSKRERRQFFIPEPRPAEASLYGTQFEIQLRNKMTQRAIARECAEWVRHKVRFRSNTSTAQMQQFAVVNDQAAYVPIQGFTSADLGFERGDAVSNIVNKLEGAPETATYLQLFDQIWTSPTQLEDVTDRVCDAIANVYVENSPAHIYFLILYHLFSEFLDDISEDVLPNDLTGYQNSAIWQALYPFQRDAATGIINKLETYNGCILADSVGLGKTFTALAVIRYYELRNKSVLVLAPKKLADNWTDFTANLTTNLFAADRFGYDVLAHTDLSRTRGQSISGLPLDRINWGNYDLVVIDESHNFRNNDAYRDRETRYQRLMRQVIREGVHTKVLMLSATPVNNRFTDLRNQLALAYEGESEALSSKLGIDSSIEQVFRQAQQAFNTWSRLPVERRTSQAILDMLDFDFFEVLDAVTIARSRKHIQSFYDTADIGAFPTRRPPESIRAPLTDLPQVPSFNEIFERLQSLTLAVYAPLSYVFPSRLPKYQDLYDTVLGQGSFRQVDRERSLQALMTTNLLKRLESSVEAFRLTLGKLATSVGDALAAIDSNSSQVSDSGFGLDDDVDEDDDDFDLPTTVGSKVKIELADMDTVSWQRDLIDDQQVIATLLAAMELVTPEHDLKLARLKARVADKLDHPINPGNRKVLLFSAFADTASYLYRELAALLTVRGVECGLVTGKERPKTTLGKGYDFQQVLTLFSPISKMKDRVLPRVHGEIDLLIGTDCISEGQNLQDCDTVINYDIHWNPVRIIQRFGRIDRIGSTNTQIQLVNFWPDITLDEYINLKERVESRMVIADLAATADDNVLTQESSDTQFRREQLRRLQDEVIELEDVRVGVSITDLGLNDFRMDLLGYLKDHGGLTAAPKGLHAVIPAQPDKGLPPGVIFALRNVSAPEAINRHNRLHPYYLVYLADDGSVVADHGQVKHLLDLVRAGCRGLNEPVTAVCDVFNKATKDGAEMRQYSALLTAAITSMIDVNETRDIDSLFTSTQTTALTDKITGLEDFELVAFLAIVEDPVRYEGY